MGPVRSLFLTRCRPHRPNSGATLRNWQNINAMMKLGPVEVVSIGADQQEAAPDGIVNWTAFNTGTLSANRSLSERIFAALWRFRLNGHPLGRHYYHRTLEKWLEDLLAAQTYDLVVIEELPLAVYIPAIRCARCKVIFDAHNVEGVLRTTISAAQHQEEGRGRGSRARIIWRRLLARKLLREERQAVTPADRVWACSDEDAAALATIYGRNRSVAVVSNTIDVQTYQRPGATPATESWASWPMTLVFPGTFAYYPNEDAALRLIHEVLPELKAMRSDVHLILLGKGPTRTMYAAAAGNSAVTITGAVEDIRPFLDRPCVVTLPIAFGGGTRLKILEAFAASRPVVSTRKGAEGLDAVDGHHLFLRETPAEIAEAVAELWNSTAKRAAMVSAALDLVRQSYSSHIAENQIRVSLNILGTSEDQPSAGPAPGFRLAPPE